MFDLKNPGRYHLDRAPLAQAIVQVQFPLVAHLQTFEGIAPVQDGLREVFPYMQRQDVQKLSIAVGPGGVNQEVAAPSTSWELTDDIGSRLLIAPGAATLSAGAEYTGIADFVGRFQHVLKILAEVEGLRRSDRLGVRYVSIAIPSPDDPTAWKRWFRPELIGWVGSGLLAPSTRLISVVNQVSVAALPSGELESLPGEAQGLFRHAYVPAGTAVPGVQIEPITDDSYVLDFDLFVVTPQPFDPNSLMAQFGALHSQIDRFFRWTLTEVGEEFFGLTSTEEGS